MEELDQGCHPDAKIINQACKKTKNNTCTYATKLNWGGYPNPKKHKLRIQKYVKTSMRIQKMIRVDTLIVFLERALKILSNVLQNPDQGHYPNRFR